MSGCWPVGCRAVSFLFRAELAGMTLIPSVSPLSEKGKSVFKKWLAFEKEQGDEAGVETVKEKAMAFVESLGEK